SLISYFREFYSNKKVIIVPFVIAIFLLASIGIIFLSGPDDATKIRELNSLEVKQTNYMLEGKSILFIIIVESTIDTHPILFSLNSQDNNNDIEANNNLNWKQKSITESLTANETKDIQFSLEIGNSTVLPVQYILTATNVDKSIDFNVNFFGNENSSIYREKKVGILNYNVITTPILKGNPFTIRTVVFNWSNITLNGLSFNFGFDSSTYSNVNYFVFPNNKISTITIKPSNQEDNQPNIAIVDCIIPIFGNDGYDHRFAFNSGSWNLNTIIMNANGFSDSLTTEKPFIISVAPKTHPVFVVHFRDQSFIDTYTAKPILDEVEDHSLELEDTLDDRSTKERYGIDFHELLLTFQPSESDIQVIQSNIRVEIHNQIGITWSLMTGKTSTNNNGFDLVIASVGTQNIVDPSETNIGGITYSNMIIIMGGWQSDNYFPYTVSYSYDVILRVHLHEIFHAYGAGHVDGAQHLMYYSAVLSGWKLTQETNKVISDNEANFDGY
ncbi:MAG: hypothetical protein ACFFD1_14875, partial [Candidatus Thorarchaeota archaeon]